MAGREIVVDASRTLSESDDGGLLRVTTLATLTVPKDETGDFADGDRMCILSDTVSTVSLVGDVGVTLKGGSASLTAKGEHLTLEKEGSNTWYVLR